MHKGCETQWDAHVERGCGQNPMYAWNGDAPYIFWCYDSPCVTCSWRAQCMQSNKHTLDVLHREDEKGDERICEMYAAT